MGAGDIIPNEGAENETEATTSNSDDIVIQEMIQEDENENVNSAADREINKDSLTLDEWVVVDYEDSSFPSIIKKIEETGAEVSVMKKNGGVGWSWPKPKDQIFYMYTDILFKLNCSSIKPYNNRGIFTIDSHHLSQWGA